MFTCAKCKAAGCTKGDLERTLKDCPSKDEKVQSEAMKEYEDPESLKIAYNAACVEAQGYCEDARLVEIIKFMHRCGYKRIGLAFCSGFVNEALEVTRILEYNGFEVVSVICKNGAHPKAEIGLEKENTIYGDPNTEMMCNPIGQAKALNESGTDFNILMGLCVGHDTLFLKYVESPVTILAVKDRVTGHNPLAAVYCSQGYYRKKLYPEDPNKYCK